MKLFVIGASGFLGKYFLLELLKSQDVEEIICLVHNTTPKIEDSRIKIIKGDVRQLSSLDMPFKVDQCIVLSGVIDGRGFSAEETMQTNFYGIEQAIAFCKLRNMKLVFVSSVNARLPKRGTYGESKLLAENALKESGLEYLIFRPALIYGKECEKGLGIIETAIRSHGVVPVPGNGKKLEQPIPVSECAAFMAWYVLHGAKNRIIELLGKDAFAYNELCKVMAECLGKKVLLVHIPIWMPVLALKIFDFLHIRIPVSLEQMYHIDFDLCGDMSAIYSETGIQGEDFKTAYKREVKD